jgi:hypothetical protein
VEAAPGSKAKRKPMDEVPIWIFVDTSGSSPCFSPGNIIILHAFLKVAARVV